MPHHSPQSTNANSFDSSSTCASFSHGVIGLARIDAGPANSVVEFHFDPVSSPATPSAPASLVIVTSQLNPSYEKSPRGPQSTTKSSVSPCFRPMPVTRVSADL